MPSIRFRLDSVSLDDIEERVRQKYGAAARVTSTEEVRIGGIGGFFARRAMDVVVDIPDPSIPPQHWTATRRGPLDDLLDRADLKDGPIPIAPVPPLSTESDAFTNVLDDLKRYASPAAPTTTRGTRSKRPVVLLRAPGDLVVIAGLGEDPLVVARALAAEGPPADVVSGGALKTTGITRVTDNRSAFAARARGVENGRATIVAYGIDAATANVAAAGAALAGIRPDQVWLAVDATRKPDDTARWVNALATAVSVQALAVLRSGWTSTPESVQSLGLPQGWSDAVG